jgi:hypothetical protein
MSFAYIIARRTGAAGNPAAAAIASAITPASAPWRSSPARSRSRKSLERRRVREEVLQGVGAPGRRARTAHRRDRREPAVGLGERQRRRDRGIAAARRGKQRGSADAETALRQGARKIMRADRNLVVGESAKAFRDEPHLGKACRFLGDRLRRPCDVGEQRHRLSLRRARRFRSVAAAARAGLRRSYARRAAGPMPESVWATSAPYAGAWKNPKVKKFAISTFARTSRFLQELDATIPLPSRHPHPAGGVRSARSIRTAGCPAR